MYSWSRGVLMYIVNCTLYIGKRVEKAGDYVCSNATTSSKVKAS